MGRFPQPVAKKYSPAVSRAGKYLSRQELPYLRSIVYREAGIRLGQRHRLELAYVKT